MPSTEVFLTFSDRAGQQLTEKRPDEQKKVISFFGELSATTRYRYRNRKKSAPTTRLSVSEKNTPSVQP